MSQQISELNSPADAELILVCNRLVVIEVEKARIWASFVDEADQDEACRPLISEQGDLEERVVALGNPTSEAGARAMALAAIAHAPKNAEGDIDIHDMHEWLAIAVAEYVAGKPAAAEKDIAR